MILLSNGGDNTHCATRRSETIVVGTVDGIAVLARTKGGWDRPTGIGRLLCQRGYRLAGRDVVRGHARRRCRAQPGRRQDVDVGQYGIDRHDLWSARAGRLKGKDVVLVGSLPAHVYISEDAGKLLARAVGPA